MGNVCTGEMKKKKSSVDRSKSQNCSNSPPNEQNVPYIVVSSASLTERIVQEHMVASIERVPGRGHRSKHRRASMAHSRRRSVTPKLQDAICFKDGKQKAKIRIPITPSSDIPYLGLKSQSANNRSNSLGNLDGPQRGDSITCRVSQRRASTGGLASVDFQQLTESDSEGETSNKPNLELLNVTEPDQSQHSSDQKIDDQVESTVTGNLDCWCFDDFSPFITEKKQEDYLGYSPELLSELIQSKLELLTVLYDKNAGPTLQRRISDLANECVLIYSTLYGAKLEKEQARLDLLSNIDIIKNVSDMRRHIDLVQTWNKYSM